MTNFFNIKSNRIFSVSLLVIYIVFGVAISLHHHNIEISSNAKISNIIDQDDLSSLEHCLPLHMHSLAECQPSQNFVILNQFECLEIILVAPKNFISTLKKRSKNPRGPPVLV